MSKRFYATCFGHDPLVGYFGAMPECPFPTAEKNSKIIRLRMAWRTGFCSINAIETEGLLYINYTRLAVLFSVIVQLFHTSLGYFQDT